MKKLVSVFLAFCLMLPAIAAAETVPDFSEFTDDMLLNLFGYVQDEIERRGLSVTRSAAQPLELKEGQYVVGEDIPAGEYTVVCSEVDNESQETADALGDLYGNLFTAMGEEEMGSAYSSLFKSLGSLSGDPKVSVKVIGAYGAELKYFELKLEESTTITLNEGTAVRIADGTCTFIPQ